jgi:hypothetical protein
MAVYTVFNALGLKLQVRAILDTDTTEFQDYLEGYEENYYYDRTKEEIYIPHRLTDHDVVGPMGGRGLSDLMIGYSRDYEDAVCAWSRDWRKVVWVNRPRQSDLDVVHATVSYISLQ